jgi:hypothetical protein
MNEGINEAFYPSLKNASFCGTFLTTGSYYSWYLYDKQSLGGLFHTAVLRVLVIQKDSGTFLSIHRHNA